MANKDSVKKSIQAVITSMMNRVLENVLENDPFIFENFKKKAPLYAALVPEEIFKASHFERRFVTPFGKAWEKVALVVAKETWGIGDLNKEIIGKVRTGRLERITEVLNWLEHANDQENRKRPNWDEELKYVLQGKGELRTVTVITDVYVENPRTQKKAAFELKAPLPNSDQTKVSKEKILKLNAMEPKMVDDAYYALPYNPYGDRQSYDWSFPARWLDMKKDSVVLIGEEFWEKLGGPGTYEIIIQAVEEIGSEYKKKIRREYLHT